MPSRRRKKKLTRWVTGILVVIAMAFITWFCYQWYIYHRAKSTRYPEFGIAIPNEYSIHGIDVSKYQDLIAWEEVRAMRVNNVQLGFAFIKATEGIDNVDAQFHRYWKKSKSNDIIRGAYHFFIGSKDGKMQAQNFIKRVELQTGDLPPVLDVEQRNGATVSQLRAEVKKWLETVENYYGVIPIIYTNVDFYNNYLGADFDKYPLWVAHYYEEQQPRIKRDWTFWQHNERGRVNGCYTIVDFDVFNGDSLEFHKLLLNR